MKKPVSKILPEGAGEEKRPDAPPDQQKTAGTKKAGWGTAERKENEEQLLWKTAFLEANVHSSLDGVLIVDADRRKILQNQKMIDLWGIPEDFVKESDERRELEWVTSMIKNAPAFLEKVEWLYAHPEEVSRDEIELVDGRFLDRYSAPVRGRDGRYYGRIWSFRDVTEKKKAELVLRMTEEKYRTLFETAPDGIVIVSPAGHYRDVNRSICRMLGYSRDEMIGMHGSKVVASEDVEEVGAALEEIQNKPAYFQEWLLKRKDGSVFKSEVIATMMPDGNIVAMVRDVTERKRSEEQIEELAGFVDHARDAILVRDPAGKILFWNRGAERIYGWTPEEALGQNIADLLYRESEVFRELNQKTLDEGEWSGEVKHQTKDGRELITEARWTLMKDRFNRPKSILAINTDVTEKKKIEAQFMRAQRMESIGTLAGGIAHDLNNILAPIMMSIELLKYKCEDEDVARILETIEVSAKRGSDIVRQVLSFARGIEGSRVEIQPRHLLKELEHIIRDTFPKNIELRISLPSDIWTIVGDPTQVHQVLLNLCVNARDAMPNGGKLTISLENSVIDEQYAALNLEVKPGNYVRMNVADSGTGISKELQEKIFEPFFTTKELHQGTGLGLSTVMAIVKSHEGIVNVYSEPGQGSIFRVYLPAAEGMLHRSGDADQQNHLPRGNGETILVVDDEASVLTITSQTLQAFGYRVLTANDGAEAVALYAQKQDSIALVLTDMMMPIMDGPAAIHALMRMNPKIKIIAASGLNANGTMAKMAGHGVKSFLTKPYTAGTLLQAIHNILHEG